MHTFVDRDGGIWDDDDFDPEGTVACHDCGLSHRDCRENGGCACEMQAAWDAVEAERTAYERVPSGLTSREYVELAVQCLDQAGLPVDAQLAVRAFVGKRVAS